MMDSLFKRSEWFRKDRFGMFIHFGLYSIPARNEWIRSMERMSIEEYEQYFEEFNPSEYDPYEWADLAVKAGMKYAVLTAKHHDGFCLFDSELTDYKSTNTPYGKDVIAEYVKAFREKGLKVGLYYSLIDWHHPDYPVYEDMNHPHRGDERFKDIEQNFENYLDYMHGQIKELCTNYGKIDILWFDFSYDNMKGEKWRAKELVEMVRTYQPDVIMDNRLETSGEGFGSIVTDKPTSYCGDFVSPEQIIPARGIVNDKGEAIPWECCMTLNNNWCYAPYDKAYKTPKMVIRKLVECVSKGGNMILNVGPAPTGVIPWQSVEILEEVGEWIRGNKESIYECGNAEIEKPEWGRYTRNKDKIYAHVFEAPIGPLALTGIDKKDIKTIRLLSDKTEVKMGESWITQAYTDPFICFGEIEHFTYPLPDDRDTVVEIRLKDKEV